MYVIVCGNNTTTYISVFVEKDDSNVLYTDEELTTIYPHPLRIGPGGQYYLDDHYSTKVQLLLGRRRAIQAPTPAVIPVNLDNSRAG